MPTAYIKKMATKHNKSIKDMEEKWEDAKKAISGSEDDPGHWGKVMVVFKKMIGEQEIISFNDFYEKQ
jgi:hypothetical protein